MESHKTHVPNHQPVVNIMNMIKWMITGSSILGKLHMFSVTIHIPSLVPDPSARHVEPQLMRSLRELPQLRFAAQPLSSNVKSNLPLRCVSAPGRLKFEPTLVVNMYLPSLYIYIYISFGSIFKFDIGVILFFISTIDTFKFILYKIFTIYLMSTQQKQYVNTLHI